MEPQGEAVAGSAQSRAAAPDARGRLERVWAATWPA
ncbi:CPBP family intramembrane metalloprotease, partial [Methylobacterium radiotolerans]